MTVYTRTCSGHTYRINMSDPEPIEHDDGTITQEPSMYAVECQSDGGWLLHYGALPTLGRAIERINQVEQDRQNMAPGIAAMAAYQASL